MGFLAIDDFERIRVLGWLGDYPSAKQASWLIEAETKLPDDIFFIENV